MRDGWEARTAWLGLVVGALSGVAIGAMGEQMAERRAPTEVPAEVLGRAISRDPLVRVVTEVCGGRRWGSAAVLDDGTVLTNRHVVDGGSRVTVWIDDREVVATAVEEGVALDVARVSADVGEAGGRRDDVGEMTEGQEVAVLSAYGRIDTTVVERRGGVGPGDPPVAWSLAADAPEGMSGGAVVDRRGALVGVVYASEHHTGRALVIPAADALDAPTSPVGQRRC